MKRKTKRRQRKTNGRARSHRPAARKVVVPRSAKRFFALSEEEQDRWTRVTHVVSKMRSDRISLTAASREFGLDRQTVLRLARSALRKQSNGRYVAKANDKLIRLLIIPTPKGLQEIAVRDSRDATQLAEYWVAVQRYLQTGDESGLQKFKGKRIKDASGKSIRLLTDTQELDRLGNAGVLSFESLYARAS
jgi:hypothetical protein